jgi:3-methyl-2-oxobutanoate hydroxymethyltransferase
MRLKNADAVYLPHSLVICGANPARLIQQKMGVMSDSKPVTVATFAAMKRKSQKITMLTAYDYSTARILDESGIDGILVGDSLAMVVQGHGTTIPVTLDQIIYHAEIVCRAVKRAMVVVDIPFPVNHHAIDRVIDDAARVMKETGCQAVKLEGGAAQATVIEALFTAGIPVMAHVGLRPQSVHLTGYRVQRDEDALMEDAFAAEKAGAFSMVVECVQGDTAARLSKQLAIPTIGIGAGAGCDGQVLVTNDLLGLTSGYVPSFVKSYVDVGEMMSSAVKSYCSEVQRSEFPGADQTFS